MDQRIAKLKHGIDAVRRFLDPPLEADAPPIEIRRAVMDAVEQHLAVTGIRQRVFPYGAVSVRILLARPEDRVPFEVVFEDFDRRILQRLNERGCDPPRGFTASVALLDEPPSAWTPGQRFAIEYAKGEPAPEPESSEVPSLKITVLKGTAARTDYSFRSALILIGRTAAAKDTRGGVRRNHIAFDERSSRVSRAHARIVFDRDRAEFRVVDEGSAHGTRLLRGETLFDVRPRQQDSRGLRLQSGDEIHVGDSALRVTF